LGIRHIRTKPYTPQTNGKAERFIKTALNEWAYATAVNTFRHRRPPSAPRASVVLLGFTPPIALPVRSVITKGLRLIGSIGGSGMFETIVPWLVGHAEMLSHLIDATLPVSEAQSAFEMALARTAGPKVQLRFDT
jgi:transposase InsO family protein